MTPRELSDELVAIIRATDLATAKGIAIDLLANLAADSTGSPVTRSAAGSDQ